MKKFRRNRTLLVVLVILSMLAAEFSAAGIPALASEQPYISVDGREEPDGFYATLSCSNFEDVANLSMQIQFDPTVMRYVSYEADSILDNALVSVTAKDDTLTLAFISTTGLYFNYRQLLTLRFELLNPEPTYTELHCTVLECTDAVMNSKAISCNDYTGFWVKNDASTNYEPFTWGDNEVTLFSDASTHIGFSKNGGFYAGSMTITYDATQMDFVGCAFAQEGLDMTLDYTSVGDENNGKVNIAFAGTALYSSTGDFLKLIFVPKTVGWCGYNVGDLILTNANLQEVSFDYNFGSSFYVTDTSAENYFAISNPDKIVTGETLDVVIDLNNNSGFAALTGSLLYDSDLFEFVSAQLNSDTLGGAMSSVSGTMPGEVRFGIVSATPITGSGQFLTVTLRAIAQNEERTKFELNIVELVDQLSIPISYTTDIGNIFVSPNHIHEWDEGSYVPPTCTEQGYTLFTCTICGDTYGDNFQDAWGHDLCYVSGYPATCTEPGCEDYEFCLRCSYTTYVEIPAVGHSYEITVIDPTCHDDGYTIYNCTTCGDYRVDDYVASPGHVYDTVVTAPTCYDDGYTTYICTVCGDWYTADYVTSPGHIMEETVTAPTCYSEGYTTYTCTVCGEWYTENYVPPLEHAAGEAVIENEVPASCTSDGSYETVSYCMYCGIELSRKTTILPATGHSHESVVTPPTCTEQGYTTYTCTVCGDSYVDEYVKATGHKYENGSCVHCGAEEPDGLTGDVNNDGRINARDARLLLRYIAGLAGDDELNLAVADYNADGRINARDARALLRYIAGLD